MRSFFERLYFDPKGLDWLIVIILSPLSMIYGTIIYIKNLATKEIDFGIKIISIGNITVGGSGKTPFAIALIKHLLAKKDTNIYYISRGYGRKSSGLVYVKKDNQILVDVGSSGDEAMLVAKECKCSVIVSEDRAKAIKLAKKDGADIIVLDDAFSKKSIKKFDILLEPSNIKNPLPFPAGGLREFYFAKNRANLIIKEGVDFSRVVECFECNDDLLFLTAISNPARVEPYLPKNVVAKIYLDDHAYFDKDDILKKLKESKAQKLLVTQKDYVKLEKFKLPIALLKLKLQIKKEQLKKIEDYLDAK
jgi:tetraacyldisaccharide 4'-kinase